LFIVVLGTCSLHRHARNEPATGVAGVQALFALAESTLPPQIIESNL